MDRNALFVRTIEDLRSKIASNDEYESLKASGLIRTLLLDSGNLVDEVNRRFRLKITFTYADSSQGYPAEMRKLLNPSQWAVLDGLYPGTQITTAVNVTTNRGPFLSQMVLINRGEELSVKDVIKYAANVLGGVHAGKVKKGESKEEALEKLTGLFGNLPTALMQLRAIAHVVLDGLEPLYVAAKVE